MPAGRENNARSKRLDGNNTQAADYLRGIGTYFLVAMFSVSEVGQDKMVVVPQCDAELG
jgi:hypothetical protein